MKYIKETHSKIHLMLALIFLSNVSFAKTLMVEVGYHNGIHQINKAWVVERDYPATRSNRISEGAINFELADQTGAVFYQGYLSKPGLLVKEPLLAHSNEIALTGNEYSPSGQYTLRLPYHPDYLTLNLKEIQFNNALGSKGVGATRLNTSDSSNGLQLGQFQIQKYLSH